MMFAGMRRLADGLIGLSATIGSIGLFFLVVVILADVVGRYFGAPLTGAQDMTQMTMVVVVFGGMALCDKLGGHIAVDVFETSFPPIVNRLTDIAGAVLGFLVFSGIAWTVYESAKLSQMLHLATNVIGLPKVYFQWVVCVFSAVTAAGMLLRTFELLLRGRNPRHDEEHSL